MLLPRTVPRGNIPRRLPERRLQRVSTPRGLQEVRPSESSCNLRAQGAAAASLGFRLRLRHVWPEGTRLHTLRVGRKARPSVRFRFVLWSRPPSGESNPCAPAWWLPTGLCGGVRRCVSGVAMRCAVCGYQPLSAVRWRCARVAHVRSSGRRSASPLAPRVGLGPGPCPSPRGVPGGRTRPTRRRARAGTDYRTRERAREERTRSEMSHESRRKKCVPFTSRSRRTARQGPSAVIN